MTAEDRSDYRTLADAWDEGYREAIEDYGCDIPWGGFTSKDNPYRAAGDPIERVMALRRPDAVLFTGQRHVDYLAGWNACLSSIRSLLAPTDSGE